MKENTFSVVRTQAASEWLGYTSDPLSIIVSINPIKCTFSLLNIRIFNSDFFPLASACSSKMVRKGSTQGETAVEFHFSIMADVYWLPESYKAIIYKGTKPLYHCDFTLHRECGVCVMLELKPYLIGSADYVLARNFYSSKLCQFLPHDSSRSQFKEQLTKLYLSDILHCREWNFCPNIVVSDIDNHGFVAHTVASCALSHLDNPILCNTKHTIWNFQRFKEKNLVALPEIAPNIKSLVIENVQGLIDSIPFGIEQLTDRLKECRSKGIRVILADAKTTIDKLFEQHPCLLDYFPQERHLTICRDITLQEIISNVICKLRLEQIRVNEEVVRRITWRMYCAVSYDGMSLQAMDIDTMLKEVQKLHHQRLVARTSADKADFFKCDEYSQELAFEDWFAVFEDFCKKLPQDSPVISQEEPSDEPQEECESLTKLKEMIGLQRVKDKIEEDIVMAKFNSIRHHYHLADSGNGRHHMLFMGNPGTGKTTVAKLIGEIYHQIGVLSKGHTIVCGRETLIGEYIGQSEQKVLEKVNEARGGVLFIDEAYTLYTQEGDKDFGRHVIESLLSILAEPNPDMIIIFAGYEDKLSSLFKMNPGLRDRFPLSLHFDDFTPMELLAIIDDLCKKQHYLFEEGVDSELLALIERHVAKRDNQFGNARWATNFFEQGILRSMAHRIMHSFHSKGFKHDTAQDIRVLSTITRSDILTAESQYLHGIAPKALSQKRIGFS